jgi:spore coat protein H
LAGCLGATIENPSFGEDPEEPDDDPPAPVRRRDAAATAPKPPAPADASGSSRASADAKPPADAGLPADAGIGSDAGTAMAMGDVAPAMPMCTPTGGGPYWLEEGQTVTASIKCATGRQHPGDDFVLEGVPAGARYDSATATLSWKTGLDSGGVYLVQVKAQPFDEVGEIKIGVADKFDDPANVPIKDKTAYTEEFGLPVMHLKTTPQFDTNLQRLREIKVSQIMNSCSPICSPSLYTPVEVVYRGHTFSNPLGKIRGASSLGYAKKNISLKFDKEDKFSEPFYLDGAIRKRRRMALISTFDDKSYVRWRLAFELWNRMDPNIIRIEHMSVVLYLNGKYHGLYTLSDKIDNNMMKRAGLAEEGNLYMGMNHDASFDLQARHGGVHTRRCAFEGFVKKEGTPECNGTTFVPSALADMGAFADFVARSDDATFRSRIPQMIEVKDYINWFVHATAIRAGDSFGKNGLHYRDPAGGPWRVVVWDYNDSLGQNWNTSRTPATFDPLSPINGVTSGAQVRNNLWRRLWNHPTIGPQMRARYASVLKNELALDEVLAAFDKLVKETEANARRDDRRWRAAEREFYQMRFNKTDFPSYSQEVAYTRQWLSARWRHLQTLYR